MTPSLNDAAMVMSLAAVYLAIKGAPRVSMALSVLSYFYMIWHWKIGRWRRRAEGE